MFHRYDYEVEFYPSLSRLPLDLRRKLDISGVKLSLKDWLAISLEERTVLCHLPCDYDEERQVFATLPRFSCQEIPRVNGGKDRTYEHRLMERVGGARRRGTAKRSAGPSGDADRMAPLAIAPSLCALQNRGLEESTESL